MIALFCSWLLLFYFFITYGFAARFLIKYKSESLTLTLLLGIVLQTILLTSTAFFTAINFPVFVANFIGASVLAVCFRKKIKELISVALKEYNSFSLFSKCILIITLLSVLMKCAQSPFILDNETYYVQTIKWLNEYGFVKGLANFNVTFGQTSPWQILQSGFNLSFITERLNDINGFLLVICTFYFLTIFEKKWQREQKFHWIGFVLFFDVLSFQFINSPSPDLPIFLIVQIVLFMFLEKVDLMKNTKLIILLFIFLAFLKITIAPLGILIFYVLYKQPKSIFFTAKVTALFGTLWGCKNIILTGYLFFPFDVLNLHIDWSVPKDLMYFNRDMIKEHKYLNLPNYKILTLWEKFSAWISFGGINGIFNKGILILFTIAPFTKIIRSRLEYKIVYIGLLLHFIAVFIVSPQFRFFLADFLFLTAIVASDIANRAKVSKRIMFSGLVVASLLPVPILFFGNFENLTENKLNQHSGEFRVSQFWLPEKNSRFGDVKFEKYLKGNLTYYSPVPNFFYYGTANGPLPCTNVNFITYIENTYNIVPQFRGSDLKDGFRSVYVSKKNLQ